MDTFLSMIEQAFTEAGATDVVRDTSSVAAVHRDGTITVHAGYRTTAGRTVLNAWVTGAVSDGFREAIRELAERCS